jgi:drug/metabolite transporter (DMT)-like permease
MTATTHNNITASTPKPTAWLIDLVLLGALWGASFLFMRIGAAEFGALPTAAVRVAIAALFLLPIALLRGQGPAIAKHWKPPSWSASSIRECRSRSSVSRC